MVVALRRASATVGLGLLWFVLVAAAGLLAGHSDAGIVLAVLVCFGGVAVGLILFALAAGDNWSGVASFLSVAWFVVAVLGLASMGKTAPAYQASYGRPQEVTVMETRCLPVSESSSCSPQARVSTMDRERDLGWLADCASPSLGRGQRAAVLADPRGWFEPQLQSCVGDGRGPRRFIAAEAVLVVALTLAQLAWVIASAVRDGTAR